LSEFRDDLRASPDEVFERVAKQWLIDTFGAVCKQPRADVDETTGHIHGMVCGRGIAPDGGPSRLRSRSPDKQVSCGQWQMVRK
jgi:hypothetical protein